MGNHLWYLIDFPQAPSESEAFLNNLNKRVTIEDRLLPMAVRDYLMRGGSFNKEGIDLVPKAVNCLHKNIDEMLTFFSFPVEQRKRMRTMSCFTNAYELLTASSTLLSPTQTNSGENTL